jgi:hypothetical protein
MKNKFKIILFIALFCLTSFLIFKDSIVPSNVSGMPTKEMFTKSLMNLLDVAYVYACMAMSYGIVFLFGGIIVLIYYWLYNIKKS